MIRYESIQFFGQPIVDVIEDRAVKVELLTRVSDPSVVDLEAFFEQLTPEESLGLTVAQYEISRDFYRRTRVPCAVNVDNKVLLNDATRQLLLETVHGNTVPVTFEFTEVFPMPPADLVNPVFNELRDHGISIALDDFGTGFNGMSLFVDYDFDIVKVDRVLTTDIKARAKKAKVLALICSMIQSIGKEHVIEGVETEETLDTLVELGFRVFQGFHFHLPAKLDDLSIPEPVAH